MAILCMWRVTGSPPLTRGKAGAAVGLVKRLRITPAYAGKSEFHKSGRIHCQDHPRLRGEKLGEGGNFFMETGSPPLTRGKAKIDSGEVETVRITPAYAGKRLISNGESTLARDHPRLRGEKLLSIPMAILFMGSPPLTRGKATMAEKVTSQPRITPAYAGKRLPLDSTAPKQEDHPRLRGEKFLLRLPPLLMLGSPPLTRGKVVGVYASYQPSGITPAYAGKRNSAYSIRHKKKDHPRLRGEKL